MTIEEKYTYMTTAPVEKIIPKLAVPTIISMLITSFYNMVDTIFVGKLNTSAQAGVGIAFSMMAIIQAFGFLFGQGSANYISRALGQKKIDKAQHMAACGFYYGISAGLLLMIAGLIFINPLCTMLGATDTSLSYTRSYLSLILIGAPVITGSFVLNNQLRFQGNAVYAMIGIVSGAVLNIALDPLLMFVFDMGVTGAALATIISQCVGFILLLIGTTKGGTIRIRIKNISFDKFYFIEMFKAGVPSLCRQGIASVSVIILNQAAGGYGDCAIAAMSIVGRVSFFLNSIIIGFGQGFQPVCGFNYGAKLYDRVKKAFWFCVKFGSIILILVSVLTFIFAQSIVTFFTKGDMEVVKTGMVALRYNCITFPLGAFTIMSNMMLQSSGKALSASVLSLARQGIFLIPILLISSSLFGLFGIQTAQPIADFCSFLLSIPLIISFFKELDKNKI